MNEQNQTPASSPRTTVMTAATFIVWSIVIATTILALALLASLIFNIPTGTLGMLDKVTLLAAGVTVEAVLILCLLGEWHHRYDRAEARYFRRLVWGMQVFFTVIYGTAAWSNGMPQRALDPVLLTCMVMIIWHSWTAGNALDAESQKVVDQVIAEQRKHRQDQLEAERAAIRKANLDAALARYSVHLAPAPSDDAETDTQTVVWTTTPGRHAAVVYFIRNGNRIKIGTTTDLHQRVRRLALRADNIALVLPGDRKAEQEFHRQFAELRIGNTEWFRDANPLTAFIAAQVELAIADAAQK